MFDYDRVRDIAREAMEDILLPAWHQRATLQSYEKTPGELVTSADLESQKFLSAALCALCPDAQFLGEEFQNENPLDMRTLDEHDRLWIVDPLDGTSNYAAGDLSFAVQIAFIERGVVKAAWIATPQKDNDGKISCCVAHAYDGQPAFLDGAPFSVKRMPFPDKPHGVMGMKHLAPEMRKEVAAQADLFGTWRLPQSAGFDIVELAKGSVDFFRFHRTLPWDFAAPLFWGARAGLFARRLSGAAIALKPDLFGLMCTRSKEDWLHVHAGLIARAFHQEAMEEGDLASDDRVLV